MHYCKDLYHATQMEGSHSVAALPYSIQPVVALVCQNEGTLHCTKGGSLQPC